MSGEDGLTVKYFEERVRQLRAALPEDVGGVAIVRGVHDDDMPVYLTTFSLQVFLTRSEIANTIIVVLRDHVYVLSRQCKDGASLSLLKTIPNTTASPCNSKTDTNRDALKQAVDAIAATGKPIGVIGDDRKLMKGPYLAEAFYQMLDASGAKQVDVQADIAKMLRVKDTLEVDMHRKAGLFVNILTQRGVVPALETAISTAEGTHASVAGKIDELIEDPSSLKGLENVKEASIAFDSVVQSGDFKADFPGTSEDTELPMKNVAVTAGVRWKQYTAVVGRTYLINATDAQKEHYNGAMAVRAKLVSSIVPGAKVADVHAAAVAALPEALRPHLHADLGFGTGIEHVDEGIRITADSDVTLAEGNVVVTRVHLGGLKKGAAAPKEGEEAPAANGDSDETYAIQLLDTVVVTDQKKEGKPEWQVLTNASKVDPAKCFFVHDEEEEEEPAADAITNAHLRKTTTDFDSSKAGGWVRTQREILEENREAYAKMSKDEKKGRNNEDNTVAGRLARGLLTKVATAKRPSGNRRVEVDQKNEIVYLSINDQMVPFHASTLASTRQTCDARTYTMHVTFKTTVAGFTPYTMFPKLAFLKEVQVRAPAAQKNELEMERTHMRNLISIVKKREQLATAEEDVVPQEGLQRKAGGGSPVIRQVYFKPQMAKGKGMAKALGNLEAHENGLRYVTKTGPPIDILYNNIKHVIACPNTPRHDRFAAVHIKLLHPIQLPSGQKTKDVQLWTEVQEGAGDDLDRSNMKTEREEELDDEYQQKIIDQINREFVKFCVGLKDRLPNGSIEIPQKHPAGYFEGLAGGTLTNVAATPTTLTAVLDTQQFFVLSMKDVEVVVFERVVQGHANFDMVCVMKDYKQPVQRIDNIPKNTLPQLKDLMCNQYRMRYYENERSTNWNEIMRTVRKTLDDDEEFNPWGSSGWEGMFNLDASEEEGEEDEESSEADTSDSEYEPTSSGSDDDSDDDAWEAGSESMDEDDDDSESSMSSSEGNRRAKKKDRKRKREDDSDDSGRKKKKRRK